LRTVICNKLVQQNWMRNGIKSLAKICQETSDMIISFTLWKRFTRAAMVLPVGRNANRSLIRLLGIVERKNFLTNSFSKILDKIGVTEIGLRSLYDDGGLTLCTGVTIESFHDSGGVDVANDLLSKWVIMSAKSKAQFLNNQYGSASAPWAVRCTECKVQ
jgi:hypothetical protein